MVKYNSINLAPRRSNIVIPLGGVGPNESVKRGQIDDILKDLPPLAGISYVCHVERK